ncbi:unnamed protein product [Phyllotreta striolata]|uniref:CN hydrolase domain-containing protein n=1 Tax=Phyllotreta striolata TaxID=444603 RepID=A0A9N9XHN1_PHYSR|nr:unnamed protein product [Phyllotreta striolata]
MMSFTKLFLLYLAIVCTVGFTKADYVAGVVEIETITGQNPNERVEGNLQQYVETIEKARDKEVQIIVFPEYGLTGKVESPSQYAIEIPYPGSATNFSNFWLTVLSNAAVANQMYVVVNLYEQERDKSNNSIYYNTNVVFGKAGNIVAKYRKINVYNEPAITSAGKNSIQPQSTFTTDFGVTFGTFISYDINFYNPAKSVTLNNVTDVVYTAAWKSRVPFYHSISTQHGYALANKVNLLAANLNNVKEGLGGSGIYGADGTIFDSYISGVPGTKLIVATVKNAQPETPFTTFALKAIPGHVPTLADFNASKYFESHKYEFRKINLSRSAIKEEVCQKYFCCSFNINVTENSVNNSDIFKIMAYKGEVRVGEIKDVRICALVSCENDDVKSCGGRNVKTTTKFNSITVETNIPDYPHQYVLPISLTGEMVPVRNTKMESSVKKSVRNSKYWATDVQQENLIAFGFIANGGVVVAFNNILLVGILYITYWFV